MEQVTEAAIDDLLRGAVHFGSGSGGDPYLGRQMLTAAIRRYGPVPLADPSTMDPDALVLPVAYAGPPSVLVEKAHGEVDAETLRAAVEARAGRSCAAVVPVQCAGVNAAVPLAVAAQLGLPCLDADLMRRCFPSIDLTIPRLAGYPIQPVTMVGGAGVLAEFSTGDSAVLGELLRAVLPGLGLTALISAYHLTAGDCARLDLGGSVSECTRIGAARSQPEYLLACRGRLLCQGTVVELMQNSTDTWPRGVVSLHTPEGFVRIDFQNENLIVSREGVVLATVPDLINLADPASGTLIQTIDLTVGQDVDVVASPADPRWHTPEGIAMAGPRAFGYAVDPVGHLT
ncbi:DUF917 domain-containing protein [Amycolatopsis jejuensis]|uniref:DUF917 domain-containing protein n=1 Tax=Amycolatopsis jejuensis TaxID=330084 RepID=UPI000527798A|nr:DUF917 domain-containing protein [Amycolatopsis jejuensis]